MPSAEDKPEDVDILIAEDSPTQAEQLKSLLSEHGFGVRLAANGREAFAAALARPPTLLITDIVMPEMDGYELCAAIKATPELKDIPVVMVTSLSGVQDIARSLECGADNFIRKPYEPRILLTRVEYILLNLELRKTSKLQAGMEVYLGGRKHFITSGREQIIDLLISTYEEAVQMNVELQQQQQELALSNRTLRALYRIAGELNRVSDEAEVCDIALRGVLDLPAFRAGWIFLDDGRGGLRPGPLCALPPELQAPETMEGDCRCRRMLRAGEIRHSAMVVECERLEQWAGATGGVPAHVSVPLTVGSQCLGLMNVTGEPGGTYGADELRLLEAVGSQAAVAIQRAELHRHLEALVEQRTAALQAEIIERTRAEQKVVRLNRIHAVLSGINTTIVRVHDRDTLFREACRIAVKLGKFRLAWIGLADPDGRRIKPLAWMGEDDDSPGRDAFPSAAEGADAQTGTFGQALRDRALATCNDLDAFPELVFPAEARARGCRSMAVFPLFVGERAVGTLALYAAEPDVFDATELTLLREVAGDISFALDHLRKEEQLDYLAYYDALTGLPNRKLIADRLGQLLQPGHEGPPRPVALLLINIERFKRINDTFGRATGDALLKFIAERLSEALDSGSNIARIGNDHFAAILSGAADAAQIAHTIEQRVLSGLRRPYVVEGHELHVAFSCGVAMSPGDGSDADTLFANAETALRKAADSQEHYLFYAPAMNARVSEQLTLENKLHRALEKEEFVLHYQPKVDLRNGAMVGMEALIRWRDPDAGLIAPMEFIPLLEETGMILDVGRWALEQAVRDYRTWHEAGLPPLPVAVNVSAVQLRRKDFLASLENALARHPGKREFLVIEITESMLMEDIETNIRVLGAARDMGVKIAVDDFGTGYSSLSYLKRFPIDFLKIDKSFVRDISTDPDAAAICIAIIGLAHNLRLTVVAEGVETESQMHYLRRQRCDEIQGFLFSPPLPAGDCAQLLKEARSLPLPEAPNARRNTLLLVDDEPNILASLTRVLRREGYEILTASTAAEAFAVLARHEVQVILSDQRMPEMNGIEFLSRVKDLYPDTIRIVLSGYTDLEAITSAVNRGAIYRFLTKPWEDDQLRQHVREAFLHYEAAQSRLERERRPPQSDS